MAPVVWKGIRWPNPVIIPIWFWWCTHLAEQHVAMPGQSKQGAAVLLSLWGTCAIPRAPFQAPPRPCHCPVHRPLSSRQSTVHPMVLSSSYARCAVRPCCWPPPPRYFIPVRQRMTLDSHFMDAAVKYIRRTWPWYNRTEGHRHFVIHTGGSARMRPDCAAPKCPHWA